MHDNTLEVQAICMGTVATRHEYIGRAYSKCVHHRQLRSELKGLWTSASDRDISAKVQHLPYHASVGVRFELLALHVWKSLRRTSLEEYYESFPQCELLRVLCTERIAGALSRKESCQSKFFWLLDDVRGSKRTSHAVSEQFGLFDQCGCENFQDSLFDRLSNPCSATLKKGFHGDLLRDNSKNDRCGFVTDTGLLGIGPSDLGRGDREFMLLKSRFAYILRHSDNDIRLVGPSFVSAMDLDAPLEGANANEDHRQREKYADSIVDQLVENVTII